MQDLLRYKIPAKVNRRGTLWFYFREELAMATERVQDILQQPQAHLSERVARLEGSQPHLATKADIQANKTSLIKWVIATGIAVAAVILTALLAAVEFLAQLLQALLL